MGQDLEETQTDTRTRIKENESISCGKDHFDGEKIKNWETRYFITGKRK